MADAWYGAISTADDKGWIQAPLPENEANGCNPAGSPFDDDPGDSPVGSGRQLPRVGEHRRRTWAT